MPVGLESRSRLKALFHTFFLLLQDRVWRFAVDPRTAELSLVGFTACEPNAGPRHALILRDTL